MNRYQVMVALSVVALLTGCDLNRKFDETQKTTNEMNETTKDMNATTKEIYKSGDDLAGGLRESYATEARLANLTAMLEEPGDSLTTKVEYAAKFTYALEFQSPRKFDSQEELIQMRVDGIREYLNQAQKLLTIRDRLKNKVAPTLKQIAEKKASLEAGTSSGSRTQVEEEISALSAKIAPEMAQLTDAQNNVRALALTMHLIKHDQYDRAEDDKSCDCPVEKKVASILSMTLSGLATADQTNQEGIFNSPILENLTLPETMVQARLKVAKQMVVERMDALLLVTVAKISDLEIQTDPQDYIKQLNSEVWESHFMDPEFHVAEQAEVLKYLSGYVQLKEECAEKKINLTPTREGQAYIGALLHADRNLPTSGVGMTPPKPKKDNHDVFNGLLLKLQ